jgi:hypothetical protein
MYNHKDVLNLKDLGWFSVENNDIIERIKDGSIKSENKIGVVRVAIQTNPMAQKYYNRREFTQIIYPSFHFYRSNSSLKENFFVRREQIESKFDRSEQFSQLNTGLKLIDGDPTVLQIVQLRYHILSELELDIVFNNINTEIEL